MKVIALFAAILAVSNASFLYAKDTLVETPISRTDVVGPSGSIHTEETAPAIARTYAAAAPIIPEYIPAPVPVPAPLPIPAPLPVPALRYAALPAPLVAPAPVLRTYEPYFYSGVPAPAFFPAARYLYK